MCARARARVYAQKQSETVMVNHQGKKKCAKKKAFSSCEFALICVYTEGEGGIDKLHQFQCVLCVL